MASACNKPLPDYSHRAFDFTVKGISDISIPANDFIDFYPTVNIISGFAENNPVTVVFNGIPPNVFLQKNNFSILLNNNISDSFGARNASQGTYPIQAVFSNPVTGSKTYNFNLTITAPVNRVALVSGYYYPSGSCGEYIYVSCTIDSVPGVPNGIMIIDRTSTSYSSYGTFDTTYGTVDCCTNTFVIPSQNVQGVTVSGSGSFNAQASPYGRVILNRTFITDTSNYQCNVTLSQN